MTITEATTRQVKTVYTASNTIEAHLVKILLNGEGIEALISGDYLQGAMGELPAVNALQVKVNNRDFHLASTIVKHWEDNKDDKDDSWIPEELR